MKVLLHTHKRGVEEEEGKWQQAAIRVERLVS